MVTSMLEKAIEIEGLLRIIRDGNPLPETYILLNIKAAELAEQAAGLEEKADEPQPETPHADFVMAAPEPQTSEVPEVVFHLEKETAANTITVPNLEVEITSTDTQAELTSEDLDLIEEDDILLSFEEPSDFSEETDATKPETAQPEASEEALSQQIVVAVADTDNAKEPEEEFAFEVTGLEKDASLEEAPLMTDTATEHTAESTPKESPESTADSSAETPFDTSDDTHSDTHSEPLAPTPKRVAKLRASFSLNDRYLYARELFNGNMKMFDSTLDFLEGIDDYSIIEDYFYSELEWNPEDTNVAAFMDILRPNFRE